MIEAFVSAVGQALTGSGGTRLIHRLWSHVASILSLSWIVSWSHGGTALTVLSEGLGYLGLPVSVEQAPVVVQGWIAERPLLLAVVGMIFLWALIKHVQPVGDEWIDDPQSPAGATMLVALVLLSGDAGAYGANAWQIAVLLAGLALLKGIVQCWDAVIYVFLTTVLQILHTPLVLLGVLTESARKTEPAPVAAGSTVMRGR